MKTWAIELFAFMLLMSVFIALICEGVANV